MKKILKKAFVFLFCVTALFFTACSDSGDNNQEPEKKPLDKENDKDDRDEPLKPEDIEVPEEDKSKNDNVLISEANEALKNGDYDKAISKYQSAYAKNPSDANKIFYALSEIATISTDSTITEFIKDDLGVKDYPATLNSILSTEWLIEYPKTRGLYAINASKKSTGDLIRVNGTKVNAYESNVTASPSFVLYDGEWIDAWDLRRYQKEPYYYLKDLVPAEDGQYLVYVSDYYRLNNGSYKNIAEEAVKDYRYNFNSSSITKSGTGSYVRLNGTETTTWSDGIIYAYYEYDTSTESWDSTNTRLRDYTLSNEGNYLCSASYFVDKYAQSLLKADKSDYIYDGDDYYDYNVPGEERLVPELSVPEWTAANDYYNGTLIKGAKTFETWQYLIYANVVNSHQKGFNESIDKIAGVFDRKTKIVKSIVDSLGNGNATLSADIISAYNLDGLLGENAVEFGKPEMNLLVATLELIDSAFNYAASYDLSADLSTAKTGFGLKDEDIINIVNSSVNAKTLTVRSAEKLTDSKNLMSDAVSRVISTYEAVKTSNSYPQFVKDAISEYGTLLCDGAKKAKTAIDNGGVFYIPTNLSGETWSASESTAAFGIDFGKIFTAGYFTDIFQRDSSKENLELYYVKSTREEKYDYTLERYVSTKTITEPAKIEGNLSAFKNKAKEDSGYASGNDANGKWWYKDISYEIGFKINRNLITDAIPGLEIKNSELKLFRISRID